MLEKASLKKQRFEIYTDEEGNITAIRAIAGFSGYSPLTTEDRSLHEVTEHHTRFLWHGTEPQFVKRILRDGLLKGGGNRKRRNEVFFSICKPGTKAKPRSHKAGKLDRVVTEPYPHNQKVTVVINVEIARKLRCRFHQAYNYAVVTLQDCPPESIELVYRTSTGEILYYRKASTDNTQSLPESITPTGTPRAQDENQCRLHDRPVTQPLTEDNLRNTDEIVKIETRSTSATGDGVHAQGDLPGTHPGPHPEEHTVPSPRAGPATSLIGSREDGTNVIKVIPRREMDYIDKDITQSEDKFEISSDCTQQLPDPLTFLAYTTAERSAQEREEFTKWETLTFDEINITWMKLKNRRKGTFQSKKDWPHMLYMKGYLVNKRSVHTATHYLIRALDPDEHGN